MSADREAIKEMQERARHESDAVLRVWLHDSRRWVQMVAKTEQANRATRVAIARVAEYGKTAFP